MALIIYQSNIRVIFFLLLIIFVSGCSSSHKKVEENTQLIQSKYKVANITEVKLVSNESTIKQNEQLKNKLNIKIIENFKDGDFVVAEKQSDKNNNAITINTDVEFNPGNRALRWAAGIFGAGKATVYVKIEAIDSYSGKSILTKTILDSMSWGGGGGNAQSFVENAVDDASKDLIEELKNIR